MYFLKFGGLRKFIPAKFVNQAIRESWSPRNLILKVGVHKSLYPRKSLPAKLCTSKVDIVDVAFPQNDSKKPVYFRKSSLRNFD